MSIETWKDEYYPVPAEAAKPETALAASGLKWMGLRPEALKKHGLEKKRGFNILDYDSYKPYHDASFYVNGCTCHLCELYANSGSIDCEACPLRLYKEGEGTLDPDNTEACSEEYHHWTVTGNPEPMISLIQAAMEEKHHG